MKKLIILFCVILVNCFCVFAQPKRTIGVSAPLSGDLQEYGQAVRNGFLLAAEENPYLENNFTVVYEDNKFLARESVTALRTLADVKNVDVIYMWGETPTFATQAMIDNFKTPVLAMSIDGSPFRGQKYLRRVIEDASAFIAPLCEELKKQGKTTIDVVQTEDPFMNAMVEALRACPNLTFMSENKVSLEEKDFRTLAAKVKASNAQSIGCFLNSSQSGNFARQLKNLNVHTQIIGTDVFDSKSEVELAEGGLEGALYPVIKIPETFRTLYQAKFGAANAQVPYAYNSYVAFKLLGDLTKTGKNVLEMVSDQDNRKSLIPTEVSMQKVSSK